MKPKTTWILLADGAQAKVFENTGRGTGLNAVTDLLFEEEPKQARELVTDKPGSFSAGGGRGAREFSSDPVQVRETRFVKSVAEVLERKHQEGAFARLIVCAAPTALGDLRTAMSNQLKAAVVEEIDKDFTNMPTPELEKRLGDRLPL